MNVFSDLLDKIHKQNYTSGLFLLVLSVTGNYIAETLSCRTRSILTNNMLIKHLLILFLIYFTINLTADEALHPMTQIQNAFFVWIFFLMFTKMNLYFTIVAFLLLAVLYTLKNFKKFYKKTNDQSLYAQTDHISKMIEGVMLITVVIGFVLYFFKQRKEHKNFKYLNFILGKVQCDHK